MSSANPNLENGIKPNLVQEKEAKVLLQSKLQTAENGKQKGE
jgi:hypothetical protein